jgi:putative Mn2+ efflux pump MntP
MPLLGSLIGFLFISAVHIDTNIIEAVIFFYISIFMFKDYKSDERTEFSISLIGYIFFALGVSLDSFGVGFALSKKILASLIDSTVFSIVSASFTFLGLEFGGVLSDIIGKKSVLIGAFGMFFLGLYNFCQFMF